MLSAYFGEKGQLKSKRRAESLAHSGNENEVRQHSSIARHAYRQGFLDWFLYQTKGKKPVDLWPQELAEDSSGAKLASGGVMFSIASGAAI